MRQIFSSQRLETVEGVARLLEDAGIAVHISQPRSYHSGRSGQFSYSEPVQAKHQPAVWIRLPEDQPRAREILRQAGLMATTRSYADLPDTATDLPQSRFAGNGRRWAWRIRLGLLAVIAAVAVFIWMGTGDTPAPAEAPAVQRPQAPATTPANADGDEDVRVRISPPPPASDDRR
ncbi:hypothetical protein [Pseudoxanthomonas koreensis]|uniref:hypothetical protein n=1 Tax=Pseudoxanthomonas koreensis TaxID=266061 RepID=UPI0035A5C010